MKNNTERQAETDNKELSTKNKEAKPKASKLKKAFKIIGIFFILLIIGLGISEYLYRNELESPLYKIQQYLTYSKEDWANYENNKKILSQSSSNTTDTSDAAPVIESPLDIKMWENAIKNKDFIPESVMEEIQRYKKRDFSKLKVAEEKPTDEEAQEAIVRNYQDQVITLLKQENATIKIGTCYTAPLQQSQDGNPEIARVTAMVSAFNKERGNLGNIQAPLDIIYDFVKYQSEPYTWYLADFSQNIPYDYKLNKDR